jgi:hypothetical protein
VRKRLQVPTRMAFVDRLRGEEEDVGHGQGGGGGTSNKMKWTAEETCGWGVFQSGWGDVLKRRRAAGLLNGIP